MYALLLTTLAALVALYKGVGMLWTAGPLAAFFCTRLPLARPT